ncbi:response regulator [Burkholderia ubonensis]|uniref:response regulator n=1 Tax=Burkholderia ubonensis TaxID=101571 RepID=UPI0007553E39|nr:response regulator [Burkholderia ubonensis]KWB93627.1 LuxR family transcriptional regulator [Burkholderia ubonensis]
MDEFFVRVMVADDHPASALGMSQAMQGNSTINLVGAVSNSTDLVAALDTQQCDVLVLDYVMPSGKYGDGLTLLSFLQRRYPALHIVTMTMIDNPSVLGAIRKQGVNYMSPHIKQLLQDVDTTPAARALTMRETEVVRLCCAGYTVGEIATQLHRSKQTISSQKASAMKKLGIVRDANLIRYAGEGELPDAPESV